MISLNERLAVLEEKVARVLDDGKAREQAQLDLLDKITTLEAAITKHNTTMEKYKGFIGGVMFVASCISAFVMKFGNSIWQVLVEKVHV